MRIRMAENFRAVFYAPFYAAQALGFYAREDVEIELVTSSAPGGGFASRRFFMVKGTGPLPANASCESDLLTRA